MSTHSGFSRREFLRRSSLLAAGGLLVACAPAAPGAAPAGGEAAAPAAAGGTIQYWFAWGSTYGGQTWDALKATDELKAVLGDYALETKGNTNAEAFLTAVAAGTPPDGASNLQYLDYMARGVLVPVDDWIAASDVIKKEKYLEGSWNDGFYQGTMYGAPANEGFLRYGLNYNTRMVEEAGLDPDDAAADLGRDLRLARSPNQIR